MQYGSVVAEALWVRHREDQLNNALLGLAGEVGEILDLHKKQRYHPRKFPPAEDKAKFERELRLEIGDVLFYLALLNQLYFGDSLVDVARDNISKLVTRWPERYAHVKLEELSL